jgi:hypothetical protein
MAENSNMKIMKAVINENVAKANIINQQQIIS